MTTVSLCIECSHIYICVCDAYMFGSSQASLSSLSQAIALSNQCALQSREKTKIILLDDWPLLVAAGTLTITLLKRLELKEQNESNYTC